VDIWIKRDDQTGLAAGGNKTRKLEYLIGEALRTGCDTVVTGGAQQSNHCRQTAAACAQAGLECHLLLGGIPPARYEGNLLLDRSLGAILHFTEAHRKGEDLERIRQWLVAEGRQPMVVPYGGSNALGVRGFVDAMAELQGQCTERAFRPDYLYFASSSGGTQAGMALGKRLQGMDHVRLRGISVDKETRQSGYLAEHIAQLVTACAPLVGFRGVCEGEDVRPLEGFDDAGYGHITQAEWTAMEGLARLEGILLDPVYTARAFAALHSHLQQGLIPPGSQVLFWHTGGMPARFIEVFASAPSENT
jgi:D-cysteine desulfhydrase